MLVTLAPLIPDECYLKCMYYLRLGYRLNLKDPNTFQEKLQWLKLNNRKPHLNTIVDKIDSKSYVGGLIGEDYINPTIQVWNNPNEIEFDTLPQSFVMKTADGGGSVGVIICKEKSAISNKSLINALRRALRQNIYRDLREWPYKDIRKRIFIEPLLEDSLSSAKGDLNDYKFYCFNEKPTYCEVISGRRTNKSIDFFDLDWNHMEFCFEGYSFYDGHIEKPKSFAEMISIVSLLCKGLPFCRVDLYEVAGKIFFGEITLYPASGFRGFYPKEWNIKLGEMLDLNLTQFA